MLKHSGSPYDLIKMPERTHADKDGAEIDHRDEDRRRSRRFTCGGEAKISRLPSDGIFLPGKILDLSLHGCRVDTTLPIDCGVRAEIVVHVNAVSFRALGEVKAIRDGSGAGIEFVQLSSSGKNMLEDLVQELARLQAVMNKLRSARRDTDATSFRAQLEDGKVQARMLSRRFPVVEAMLAAETSESSSQPEQSASPAKDRMVEERPLVITVDLFG